MIKTILMVIGVICIGYVLFNGKVKDVAKQTTNVVTSVAKDVSSNTAETVKKNIN